MPHIPRLSKSARTLCAFDHISEFIQAINVGQLSLCSPTH